ncbi:MAG TPA: hypothetical protein VD905_03435 [Flavobacteriales bacterium]|nr:hypothetical protein [Flavobacteriales bacterium]
MKLIYCLFFMAAGITATAQSLNVRKLPTIEVASQFKNQTLVFITLTEDPENGPKMAKKDPANYKIYQESIKIYNDAAQEYGQMFVGIFKEKKHMTIDEIMKMKGSEFAGFAFILPYTITTGGTSYYEGMLYDLYKKADWALLKENYYKLTDFTTQFSKGVFQQGSKQHFQWGLFSRVEINGKATCSFSYAMNFPQTEMPLSKADMLYMHKCTKNYFDKIIKDGTSDLKPSDDNALLKAKTLYVCSANLLKGFEATTLTSSYKGKVEVLSKDQYDSKLLAGEDALFLVVYPWAYNKGVTAALAKLAFAHIILDGKTMNAVKNYTPNKVFTGKNDKLTFEGDFEKITDQTVIEYNKAF